MADAYWDMGYRQLTQHCGAGGEKGVAGPPTAAAVLEARLTLERVKESRAHVKAVEALVQSVEESRRVMWMLVAATWFMSLAVMAMAVAS